MTDFHPFSFVIGVIAGAVGITLLYAWVLVTVNHRRNKRPEPQDWSRHAR